MRNKQAPKNEYSINDPQQDMQFLLSNIRARENGLIFFLERFTAECKSPDQFLIFKEEFLQKQKIYANQVNRIISKYCTPFKIRISEQQSRTLWIKVKSIIKVSLDRLRILNLLNQRIFLRYEEIIKLINKNYDDEKGLEEFPSIQNLLRKRNADAIAYGRSHFNLQNSDSKMSKNRSESAFKNSKFSPKARQNIGDGIKLEFEKSQKENRLKSLNRYRKKKILLQSKSSPAKQTEKNLKKINKALEKFHKLLEGAVDGAYDTGNLDKKKTMKENEEILYEELFKRNIPNHKMISKFYFGACGMNDIFISKVKKPRAKAKKIVSKGQKEQFNKSKASKEHPVQVNLLMSGFVAKEKQPNRPQSSQTIHLKVMEEQKRSIGTALMTKKHTRYIRNKPKLSNKTEKYAKLFKLIS